MTKTMEKKLLDAMRNAMCGDFCYDLNCTGCEHARLLAMEAVVFSRVLERWEQLMRPLRVMARDGLLPKSLQKELVEVNKALRKESNL
jgi:hypothetical protein